MKIRIIPTDNYISVDGSFILLPELASLMPGILLLEWSGTIGFIEYAPDANGVTPPNATIRSLDSIKPVMDLWEQAVFLAANPQPIGRTLADVVKDALIQIDNLASIARGRYISAGIGQEATYQLKQQESLAFIAAGRPVDTTSFYLLTAEAVATQSTVGDIADMVVAMYNMWIQLAAAIEGIRMGTKKAIRDAATISDVGAIMMAAAIRLDSI